jgi:hypothetical protein
LTRICLSWWNIGERADAGMSLFGISL